MPPCLMPHAAPKNRKLTQAEGTEEMTAEERTQILRLLDGERQTVIYPDVTRLCDGGVIKDLSADGKSCEIAYSSCAVAEVDARINHQIQAARRAGYQPEWKVYGHDQPPCLPERLVAAGFEAGEREAFMVLRADRASMASLDGFREGGHDIRRVTSRAGLADYRIVREAVCGTSCEQEIERYVSVLEHHPDHMSVYVGYVDGEPAACGRVYFHADSQFAALYGGNTRPAFRNRGLFTQIVAVRIREALGRGITTLCVDALPTSEPILKKRGFEVVTYTQPFCLV